MGQYINDRDVELRLAGKVRFTDDPDANEQRMPRELLRRLILEAEGHVEFDLSPRYGAPFQTDSGGPFKQLPARPTQEYLRTMCELQAVIRVLETDFGSGTVVDAEKYKQSQEARYNAMLEKLMRRREPDGAGWVYPPLPGLRLNAHNELGDDGTLGRVFVTSEGDGDYPGARINDPSETFFNFDRSQG